MDNSVSVPSDPAWAQKQQFLGWLDQKWPLSRRQCPICSANQWSLTDLLEVRMFAGGGLQVGAPVAPVMGVVCQTCGFVHWFSAVVAGVVPPAPPQGSAP